MKWRDKLIQRIESLNKSFEFFISRKFVLGYLSKQLVHKNFFKLSKKKN